MKVVTLISGLIALTIGSTALAGHCPKDAKAIKHALDNANISMSAKQEILALSDKGMDLHRSGNHRESERVLAEAMRKTLMMK